MFTYSDILILISYGDAYGLTVAQDHLNALAKDAV